MATPRSVSMTRDRRPPPPSFRPPPLPPPSSDESCCIVRRRSSTRLSDSNKHRRSKTVDSFANEENQNNSMKTVLDASHHFNDATTILNSEKKAADDGSECNNYSSTEETTCNEIRTDVVDKNKHVSTLCNKPDNEEGTPQESYERKDFIKDMKDPTDSPKSVKTKALLNELNDMDEHFKRKSQASNNNETEIYENKGITVVGPSTLLAQHKLKIKQKNKELNSTLSRLDEFLYLATNAAVCKAGESTLNDAGIRLIIRIGSNVVSNPYEQSNIRIYDVPNDVYVLSDRFDEISDMIADVVEGNESVLVQCEEGSVSAAVCIAFFVKKRRMGLEEAYQIIKAKRADVKPNSTLYLKLLDFAENQRLMENMSPLQKSQHETFKNISQNWLPCSIYILSIGIIIKFLIDVLVNTLSGNQG